MKSKQLTVVYVSLPFDGYDKAIPLQEPIVYEPIPDTVFVYKPVDWDTVPERLKENVDILNDAWIINLRGTHEE